MPWSAPSALRFRRRALGPDISIHPSPSLNSSISIDSASGLDGLWDSAIEQYRRSLNVDLQDPSLSFVDDLQHCSTAEQILDVLQAKSKYLHNKRQGNKTSRVLRDVLKPLVHGLIVILDVGAEVASSSVRSFSFFRSQALLNHGSTGGSRRQGYICSYRCATEGENDAPYVIGLLDISDSPPQAADRVGTTFDDLKKLLERLGTYVERLQARVQVPMRSGARVVAVKALVEILKALALATKMLRKNRIGMRPVGPSLTSTINHDNRAFSWGSVYKVERSTLGHSRS